MPNNEAFNIQDGRRRVVIESVTPEIDGGRYPIKRVVGEEIVVEADIFADGHDVLSAVLKFRQGAKARWTETPMRPLVNDRWRGSFTVQQLGRALYAIEAWVNHFESWRHDLEKKVKVGMDVAVELVVGSRLLTEAAKRATGTEMEELSKAAQDLAANSARAVADKIALALSPRIAELMAQHAGRQHVTRYDRELAVTVDPVLARFGAWYEIFPRSCSPEPGRHGTFKDVEGLMPRVAEMGFDVLYLAPIHPIGRAFRKGPNNALSSSPDDPGSPWGIGSEEGGHKAIHPQLGTLEDFRRMLDRAAQFKIQIALDVAFQCSPDHPYVREHPEWFRHRPDGSIQYAENPPKKYQDIYPLNFETDDWRGLWEELKSVFEFWIEQGVRIFRVDNPHTKTLHFWEWCIAELKQRWPETIFLSEAFTRPKLMYNLAKLGFTQSYNYFPWRNNRHELTTYLEELTQTEVREFFRPNLWPNTPDILTQYLQADGRAAFIVRFVLAATLGASYGIYGPAFELCENKPREQGSEEYLNSEKYEIRRWDRNAPGNINGIVALVNRIRRENSALHSNESLRFHLADNDQLIAFSKQSADLKNVVLVVVNLDPNRTQCGWLRIPPEDWGVKPGENYQVHDLLTDARYTWNGQVNYIELRPHEMPAHIFRLRRYSASENDFI